MYFAQAAPQDPDFLALDVLQKSSSGDIQRSGKEPGKLNGVLPPAVTADLILQSYGDASRQEPFKPAVNVALVGQENQDAWYVTEDLRGVTSCAKLKFKQ
jgi:hypothetical protein